MMGVGVDTGKDLKKRYHISSNRSPPACIRTILSEPQLLLETRLVFETRLLLEPTGLPAFNFYFKV